MWIIIYTGYLGTPRRPTPLPWKRPEIEKFQSATKQVWGNILAYFLSEFESVWSVEVCSQSPRAGRAYRRYTEGVRRGMVEPPVDLLGDMLLPNTRRQHEDWRRQEQGEDAKEEVEEREEVKEREVKEREEEEVEEDKEEKCLRSQEEGVL